MFWRPRVAIRGAMIQKREALRSIKREIAQLVEKEKRIEEDLVRFCDALAPHNHNVLPNEIPGHVFIQVTQDHESVHFPIRKGNIPPQLTISHVCSHWRRVALGTAELWSNTRLEVAHPQRMKSDHIFRLHQRWLLRAGTFPVTLSVHFDEELEIDDVARTLQKIVWNVQVKSLHLDLSTEEFVGLSNLPQSAFSNVAELDLELSHSDEAVVNMNNPSHLITKLRSVTFCCDESGDWFDQLSPTLRWSQLRTLRFDMAIQDLYPIFVILRQIPILEELLLTVSPMNIDQFGILEERPLILPSLRDFNLMTVGTEEVTDDGIDLDKLLRGVTCPSLTRLALSTLTWTHWTGETFKLLGRQYNTSRLQEVYLFSYFVLPVSSILQNMPMLRLLLAGPDIQLDDEAIIGISNGALGRFLQTLTINVTGDLGEVLSMIKARKRTVDESLKNGCSWREEIALLKDITVVTKRKKEYKQRVIALKKAGIIIKFSKP
jgi:hypothetical protein